MAQENVVVVRFSDQSKAYQALSVLKDCNADGRDGKHQSNPLYHRATRRDPRAMPGSLGHERRSRTRKGPKTSDTARAC